MSHVIQSTGVSESHSFQQMFWSSCWFWLSALMTHAAVALHTHSSPCGLIALLSKTTSTSRNLGLAMWLAWANETLVDLTQPEAWQSTCVCHFLSAVSGIGRQQALAVSEVAWGYLRYNTLRGKQLHSPQGSAKPANSPSPLNLQKDPSQGQPTWPIADGRCTNETNWDQHPLSSWPLNSRAMMNGYFSSHWVLRQLIHIMMARDNWYKYSQGHCIKLSPA